MSELQKEKINEVFRTSDYDAFKFMKENRPVQGNRMQKIRRNIEKHGWIFNPIIVNEKFEIIDGQGRFEVLKELNLPVEFIVCEGLGAKECIALNTSTTTWTIKDYIESFMNAGNSNYERLWRLINKYEAYGIGTHEITFATHGTVNIPSGIIKDGAFICSEEQFEMADSLLDYIKHFSKSTKAANKGKPYFMYCAIMFITKLELAEPKKLLQNYEKYIGSTIAPYYTTMDGALKTLNLIYGYKSSKKVHFEIEYEKFMMGQYSWYSKKHGKYLQETFLSENN